jgi:RNA polymerase sigma factor (sigma-70 family)
MTPSLPLRLLQTQSDARLLELARGGHERAFEALVQRYRKPLFSYCRRLLLPAARAEDALQQGLLQAWLALRDGAEVRDAKAWLYRIVHNAAISALRRSGYDYVELDESLHGGRAPDSDLDRRIAVREALAGIAALPEAQREVLLRTAVQGHSHEQVAAALGMTDGAVRGLIYRARATLRAAASALTPPQIVLWAARAAEDGASHAQFAEITAGGGSAGLAGLLLKGGVVVMSAGALATGATLVQHAGSSPSNAQADPVGRPSHHRPLNRGSGSINESGLGSGLTSISSSSTTPAGAAKHRRGVDDHPRRRRRSDDDRNDSGHDPISDLHADDGSSSPIGGHDGSPLGGPGPSGSGGNDRSGGGPPSGDGNGSKGGSDHEKGSSPGGSGDGSLSGLDGGGPGKRDPAPADESAPPEAILGTDGGSSGGPGGGTTTESKGGGDSSGESGDSSTEASKH